MEEFFGEFPRKKTAAEIVRRLDGCSHLILLANAPLADDPGSVVPCRSRSRTRSGPRILGQQARRPGVAAEATWSSTADECSTRGSAAPGATGAARGISALTEQQELWAIEQGFDEIVVKTKNKFYDMRGNA